MVEIEGTGQCQMRLLQEVAKQGERFPTIPSLREIGEHSLGRVRTVFVSKPGSTEMKHKEDRTTVDRVQTAEAVMRFLRELATRRSEKSAQRRKEKQPSKKRSLEESPANVTANDTTSWEDEEEDEFESVMDEIASWGENSKLTDWYRRPGRGCWATCYSDRGYRLSTHCVWDRTRSGMGVEKVWEDNSNGWRRKATSLGITTCGNTLVGKKYFRSFLCDRTGWFSTFAWHRGHA
eukprot:GHVO01024407.1.p1 GENE.GHVO01024407.1~~GHVO01024407.1.p1  ORF type:complete len:245 (+),score=22.18 GHVO01024407.1:33-737(+)